MPAGQIDDCLDIIAAMNVMTGGEGPFITHKVIYSIIDATSLGDAPWNHFNLNYPDEQNKTLHHGKWMTSLCGSTTHSPSFIICFPTLTLIGASTIHHFKNAIRTTTISMKTLCLETGARNRQYVWLIKIFIMLTYNIECDCWEANGSLIDTHSNYHWEWQNYGLHCNGSEWILAHIHLNWKHSQ